jgi:hypothetical protein
MSAAVRAEIHEHALKLLDGRLAQLSDAQRAFFRKVYPKVTRDNIESAIDICDRTIRKNIADPSRLAPPPTTGDGV